MIIYVGYHGTSKNNTNNIMNNGFMKNSKIGWLGTGIYFYEGNKNLAINWGKYCFPKEIINTVKCTIRIPCNEVFDITDPNGEHAIKFHRVRDALISRIKLYKINLDVKSGRDFDGKTYNTICLKNNYKMVRAFTYSYQSIDREHRLFSRVPNGIELCLKDNAYISSKELL
jgi:hypothetical protein